ncbi:MAG: MotA/TolQ/ExbB proton channel family protein [Gammaproteobacteria bacterium]|nr:MotA/TolQ/ExbB proton channel family protein [Gammaproteobacteria bacterium]
MRHKILALLLFLLSTVGFSASANAATNTTTIANVESQLIAEIKQSNQQYQRQVKKIAHARTILLKQLAIEETKLKTLSVAAATITRAKDEQNLTLTKLEQRLQSWQQQQNYLNNVLASIDPHSVINSADQLSTYLDNQTKSSEFIAATIALNNGEMIDGQRLALGPSHWFMSDGQDRGGLINQVEQQWQLALEFDSRQLEQLSEVLTNQRGMLALDPSNNRSLVLAQHQESLVEHLNKGGIWVLPIIAFALLALVIALFKAAVLMRLPSIDQTLLSLKNLPRHQLALASIATRYSQPSQQQQRDDLLLDQLIQTKHQVERGLSAIAVTASVAPLLGLLGTVSGMIKTFKLMTLFGAGDANAVSGGISESLVTTELGLIVAIPALVVHALMSRRCHHYMAGLESYAVKLSHQISPDTDTDSAVRDEVANAA